MSEVVKKPKRVGKPKRGIVIQPMPRTGILCDVPVFSDEQKEAWKNSSEGFFQWLYDIEPRVPSSKGGYEVFKIALFQRNFVRKALHRKKNGNYYHQTIILTFPRRHSKTTLNALL